MAKNIAILASGSGTNAENLINYFSEKEVARVQLVLANRQSAYVLERARKFAVPCAYFSTEFWKDGRAILALLKEEKIDLVVLAGFLAHIPEVLLRAYPERMVNIHPSLLPKFGGKGMYGDRVHEAVLASGEKESGITIHYTNEVYDAGRIIAQYKCPVRPDDTPVSLANRVHALEYMYYPRVIEQVLTTL